jgi:protein-disulfide isomerase
VLAVAGLVVLAVVVAVVLGVVLTGRSSDGRPAAPAVGSLRGALSGAADVEALFRGIPQRGTTLGPPRAPVTMVEYVDAQCPYCRAFETVVLPDLVRRYVRRGTLRIELRMWAFIGPDSARGQAAVLAAGNQSHAFDYLALLYRQQGAENTGWLDEDLVTQVAASIPRLRVQRLLDERASSAVAAAAGEVAALAQEDGVTGTPSVLVGKTGETPTLVPLSSSTDAGPVIRAIERAAG